MVRKKLTPERRALYLDLLRRFPDGPPHGEEERKRKLGRFYANRKGEIAIYGYNGTPEQEIAVVHRLYEQAKKIRDASLRTNPSETHETLQGNFEQMLFHLDQARRNVAQEIGSPTDVQDISNLVLGLIQKTPNPDTRGEFYARFERTLQREYC